MSQTPSAFPVYIGWDEREDTSYQVCVKSLLHHSSIPLRIHALDDRALRSQGLFWRPWRRKRWGGGTDLLDGKPFSTDFAFTRFLVPHLCHRGWALFTDLDFLWRSDVAELVSLCDDSYAVMVVQHKHIPPESMKMDGMVQAAYTRKNWSSLILWNCDHPANKALTLQDINTRPGRWLHGFQWCKDEEIGWLPQSWNWLEGFSDPDIDPKAVHFTRGTPAMEDYMNVGYADEWRSVLSGGTPWGCT